MKIPELKNIPYGRNITSTLSLGIDQPLFFIICLCIAIIQQASLLIARLYSSISSVIRSTFCKKDPDIYNSLNKNILLGYSASHELNQIQLGPYFFNDPRYRQSITVNGKSLKDVAGNWTEFLKSHLQTEGFQDNQIKHIFTAIEHQIFVPLIKQSQEEINLKIPNTLMSMTAIKRKEAIELEKLEELNKRSTHVTIQENGCHIDHKFIMYCYTTLEPSDVDRYLTGIIFFNIKVFISKESEEKNQIEYSWHLQKPHD